MIITPIRCDGPPSPYQSLKNRTPSRPWSYYRRTKQLGHLPACHWTTTVPMGSCIARPPQDAMRAIMVVGRSQDRQRIVRAIVAFVIHDADDKYQIGRQQAPALEILRH